MARVKGQNIPSIFKLLYAGSLAPAVFSHTTYHNRYNTVKYNQTKYRSAYYVRRRTPFRMPNRQGRDDIHSATVEEIASHTPYTWRRKKGGTPSAAQLWVRNTFCKGAACFRVQPATGGWDGESSGPRGRDWWYALSQGTGLYYYPNFMSHTLIPLFGSKIFDWYAPINYSTRVRGSDGQRRWPHLYIKTDEADFLTFYADMSSLYGWSWSAGSDPDVIAHTMCKTVYDEIIVISDGLHDIWRTPGETGALGAGDCEDKGMLAYAMIWKTLKDIGKSDIYINNRLRCIGYYDGDIGHCVGIWKDNNGTDRALPTTGVIGGPGASISDCKLLENVIGKTAMYQWGKSETRLPYTRGVPYTPEWCPGFLDRIYVADCLNSRIQIFSNKFTFLLKFGSYGTGDGQFDFPIDVSIRGNNLYVADFDNHRVQVFNLMGDFVFKFGEVGTGDGQFSYPSSLFVTDSKIYVADQANNRIQVFDLAGNFLLKFGSYGEGDGQFKYPVGVTVKYNRIYVSSYADNRVQAFDLSGNFLFKFGGYGSGDGQFKNPWGLTVTGTRIYVADRGNHRVQIFTTYGNFISKFGSYGSAMGEFNMPWDVAVVAGYIFVTDSANHKVQVFNLQGGYIRYFGKSGNGDGEFNSPRGIYASRKT